MTIVWNHLSMLSRSLISRGWWRTYFGGKPCDQTAPRKTDLVHANRWRQEDEISGKTIFRGVTILLLNRYSVFRINGPTKRFVGLSGYARLPDWTRWKWPPSTKCCLLPGQLRSDSHGTCSSIYHPWNPEKWSFMIFWDQAYFHKATFGIEGIPQT